MDRLPYALSLGTLGLLGVFAVRTVDSVDRRLQEMEQTAAGERQDANELRQDIATLNGEIARLETELATSRDELERSELVLDRLQTTEGELETLGRSLARYEERIETVVQAQASIDPAAIDANFEDLGRELSERWTAVHDVATSAAAAADQSLEQLEALRRPDVDNRRLWNELVGPVVQLAGEDSVGSGVLVRGPESSGSPVSCDYVLTAWHVVRDIQGSLHNRDMPVPVAIYESETEIRNETAALLDFDVDIDVALLRLNAGERCSNVVALPSVRRSRELEIFDEIYAVGCPLGNDPIPTVGQVAATRHEVDGQTYLMINAPTYVGNSGGGIFDADSKELLGIFSKVYTHGSLRPTIVTHMGLVTPMHVVYDWLGDVGFGFLDPTTSYAETTEPSEPSTVREASAEER